MFSNLLYNNNKFYFILYFIVFFDIKTNFSIERVYMKSKRNLSLIISNIISIILIIAVILVLVAAFLFKNTNSSPSFFGYNIYIMNGTSMEPNVPDGNAVFVKKGPLPENPANKIALCNVTADKTTVLGVYGTKIDENGNLLYLMRSVSENNRIITVNEDDIIGEAVKHSAVLGKIIRFATSREGIVLFVVIPGLLLIIFQITKILRKVDDDEFEYDYEDKDENEDEYLDSKKIPESSLEKIQKISITANATYRRDEFVKRTPPKIVVNEEDDDEDEFFDEIPEPVKVSVDENGIATYPSKKITADIEQFNEVISHNKQQSANTPKTSTPTRSTITKKTISQPYPQKSEAISQTNNQKKASPLYEHKPRSIYEKTHEFEFKATPDDLLKVKNPSINSPQVTKKINPNTILPPVKKTNVNQPARKKPNQTLEELMDLLNKKSGGN